MQQAIEQHFSKAVALMGEGLAAPLQAMHSVALSLESRTNALGLLLNAQHDLVSELASASAGMVSLQRMHEEQWNDELDALRQIHTGFQEIARGMNGTQGSLDALFKSQRYSTSFTFLNGAAFAVERLFVWSVRELEHRVGLDVGNSECRSKSIRSETRT